MPICIYFNLTFMAERVGFEPTEACTSTDFECVMSFGTYRKITEVKRRRKTLENLEK